MSWASASGLTVAGGPASGASAKSISPNLIPGRLAAAAGPAVTRFAVGDQVFGTIAPRFGAHAEFVCLAEDAAVAPKPASLSYPEAAALIDGTALCPAGRRPALRAGSTDNQEPDSRALGFRTLATGTIAVTGAVLKWRAHEYVLGNLHPAPAVPAGRDRSSWDES